MNSKPFVISLLALGLVACGSPEEQASQVEETIDLAAQAQEIAKNHLIIDTHIDVPYRLHNNMEDVAFRTESGDFDYVRGKEGGLDAPFMAIYIPASEEEAGTATATADMLIDLVEKIVTDAPEKFSLAYTTADIEKAFAEGKIAMPMGMENGSPIAGSLENLKHFYDRGIRYITLAHSLSNHISDSSYDPNKRWGGLSDFGKELVPEMNKIGIMVDISHVSDGAFWDVMEISKVPAIASHSSARFFTPGFERNMNDDMIKELAKNGGVIQINYGSSFLTEEANKFGDVRTAAFEAYADANDVEKTLDNRIVWLEENAADFPYPYATLDQTLDHFDHIVELVGIDHVGVGSDYDGVGDSLPLGLKDVSSYPTLIEGLLGRGYSEEDIAKILGGNLMRVWKEVEAYAANPTS